MIILRNKIFAVVPSQTKGLVTGLQKAAQPGKVNIPSSRGNNIQIEQMKTIRQSMINQRQRQAIQAQERLARSRQLAQIQKTEMKKDLAKNKQLINAVESGKNDINPAERNWGLVKTSSKPVPPVSMKN